MAGHRSFFRTAALGATLALSPAALAQTATDRPTSTHAHSFDRDQGPNPFRGSALVFEQSVTTATTGVGQTPQSYVPLYELWLSFRPRYSFDEHWSLRGRFDYTKEVTNDQATTYFREDVFGDLWTDLVYATNVDALWRATKVDLGLRATWPISKVSQANGVYTTLGVRAGAAHEFTIHGDGAPFLNNAHVSLRGVYLHPFSTATTPTDFGNFSYARENTDAQLFISDQIQGLTLVNHEFWATLEGGLQLTPKLSVMAFLVLVNQWHYLPASSATVYTLTGPANIPRSSSDQQYIENLWILTSVDYQLFDELELSVGYYNLANAIAPDGKVRTVFGPDNIWWSPDARFLLAVTANLDALYDDFVGRKSSPRSASASTRGAAPAPATGLAGCW